MEKEVPDEINDHYTIFGKDAPDVDYDSIGPCFGWILDVISIN